MDNIKEKIETVLDKLRPYLINDGGNIEFIDYQNGICYLKFLGHCANCSLMNVTFNEGIKEALINEIPEITDVEVVNEVSEDELNFFDVNLDDDF